MCLLIPSCVFFFNGKMNHPYTLRPICTAFCESALFIGSTKFITHSCMFRFTFPFYESSHLIVKSMARFRLVHPSRNFSLIGESVAWTETVCENQNFSIALEYFLFFFILNQFHICGKLYGVDRRWKCDSGKISPLHICMSSQQPMHEKEWTSQMLRMHTAYGRAEKCPQYGVCSTNLAQLPFIALPSLRQLKIGAIMEMRW